MIIKIGTYNLQFEDELSKKYKELMFSDLQSAALSFVESATGHSDMFLVCKNYTKEQVREMIATGIVAELSLFGVNADV